MHKGVNTTCDEGQTMIAHSLRGEGFDASEDGTGRGTPLVPVAFAQNSRDEVRLMNGDGGIVGALSAEPGMKQACYVAFDIHGVPATAGATPTDVHTPLRARAPGGSEASTTTVVTAPTITAANDPSRSPQSSEITAQVAAVAAASSAVRRLTPRECERLQGFPDDYTRISEKAADGPRYKALGNSMAVPVMRWIGQRINKEITR
jgi:DNA (cytosine-5)-methyltransferase 1